MAFKLLFVFFLEKNGTSSVQGFSKISPYLKIKE